MSIYAVYVLMGFVLSPSVMLRVFWMPDPPPSWLSIFIKLGIAGAVGGGLGGMLGHMLSDPMPGHALIAAASGSLFLGGFMAATARDQQRRG